MAEASLAAIVTLFGALCAARGLTRSKKPVRQAHLRGRCLRRAEEALALLERSHSGVHSDRLRLGRHFFPPQTATGHLAFIGTTGSGKTLLQRLLMQSVLPSVGQGSGQRAVVYDAKQDILSILSGMGLSAPVHILNPLDARSVAWAMAADIKNPAAALQVATMLVPESKNDANPFFTNAARQLVYGALLALMERSAGQWTFRQALLLLRDAKRLQGLLAQSGSTEHLLSHFAHPATAQNILSTVLTYTTPYEIIAACWDQASHALSLSDWFKTESILVLGNDEQNRAALDTINRLLFRRLTELAISGSEVNEGTRRRTWFLLDEVREAGKLDLLGRLLTKGRSKGVAVCLGFQDISGMREAYGRELADDLLAQCNTKVILRLNGPETAAWAAKLFGSREVLESRRGESKNHRVSLNAEASSGESLSHAITQQPLILDSEIMGLPETSRENGIDALFINPTTGPFRDHIDPAWLSEHLLPPDDSTENFVPRPDEHQYLRPWGPADDAVFGFGQPAPATEASRAEEHSWCQ